ncbi:MAG TPA: hypothetical protein VJN88_11945 [Ktedonobacterales bacterium]|nr:hypothetical protein [Ktedonobacterales bacterium]
MQWRNKPERTKSLLRVYNRVKRYEYTNAAEAYRILEEVRPELGTYTAPPDCWHNTSIVANRVDHPDAELELVVNGLDEWPENVDLLCDALALYTTAGTATDPIRSDEIWRRLDAMPRASTGPYWRFWCYGAIYLSHDKNQPADALKLLDDGLAMVKRDAVMNILTSYRRILVDGNPQRTLDGLEDVKNYHQNEVLGLLEARYRFGIEMGVENAYVLAREIAQLYQERAGFEYFKDDGATNGDAGSRGDDIRPNESLTKALGFLDLAEALYTGSSNHSILDIYVARARILMAQHRYGEALNLMKCLPPARREELSTAAMMAYAAYTIGEPNPNEATARASAEESTNEEAKIAEIQSRTISALFANDGRELERLVRDNMELRPVLLAVLKRLSSDG